MAWRPLEHYDISDRWRVSSLVQALLELVLILCVFLCAIISITTTKLIKASGLLRTCDSCDVLNRPARTRSDAKDCQKLNSCGRPTDGPNSTWVYPAAVNIFCEGCTLSLSDCACTLKHASLVDDNSSGSVHSSVVDEKNTSSNGFDSTFWPIQDTCSQKQQGSCSFSENLDVTYDGSEHIAIDTTTMLDGCGCQRCSGTPGNAMSPGGVLKRKFAEVFTHDSMDSSFRDKAHVLGDSPPLTIGRGPAEMRDRENGQETRDGTPRRFLSDASDTNFSERFFLEGSVRTSPQESFSYNRRSSFNSSRSAQTSTNRKGENQSIDSDLLLGGSTPEWYGSVASPRYEMEGEESIVHDNDTENSAMEPREALEEEQEVLTALYAELEEERNASSSAAHEAMAMITRLQEEKAAVQMEAWQYQRVVEEKEQYDQEAIAMLQDILLRRDEQMFILEEELNLYRKRLRTMSTDEVIDKTVGSPKCANDLLLIERETLLLEGSEDWKNKRNSRDEKLLAEIKNWLHMANAKVKLEGVDNLDIPTNFQKISGKVSDSAVSYGRKNLLDSFSSVAPEESRMDGFANDDAQTHGDTAARYEAFEGMMESLRKEPTLRDEKSLETLNKIEEKFHRQSSKGTVRSGDELREIWKNTLRSFENEEAVDDEVCESEELKMQNPITAAGPASSDDSSSRNEGGEADADRLIEEKRMSVLEYVWKFEEQLHQLGNNKPLQAGKSGLSTVESVVETPPESKGASPEIIDLDKRRRLLSGPERPAPIKTRIRKFAADGRNPTGDVERDRFIVRGEHAPSKEKATTIHDIRFESSPDMEEDSNQDGFSVIRDVYEVQRGADKPSMELAHNERKVKQFSHDVKKSVSTVRELVRGHYIDVHETAHCEEDFIFDSAKKPSLIAGNKLVEHETDSTGRQYQENLESYTLSTEERGIFEHGDVRPSDSEDLLQTPSIVHTDARRPKKEEIVKQLAHRLKFLESDRQVMENTISSLRRENYEMKLLQKIAEQLRESEETDLSTSDSWQADDLAIVPTVEADGAIPRPWGPWSLLQRSAGRAIWTP